MIELRDKFRGELIADYHLVVGQSINDWLAEHIDDFEVRENPPISISINNQLTIQKGWGHVMRRDDVIVIVSEPKAAVGVYLLKAVIGAAISYAVTALTTPEIPDNYGGTAPTGSSIYAANGQANTPRLNGVIAEQFGMHKIFPSNLTQPWRQYEDNEQWLYMSLSCGIGWYYAHSINIGNTVMLKIDFPGTSMTSTRSDGEYHLEYYSPGQNITTSNSLAALNIYTSLEVGGGSAGAGFDLNAETTLGETVGPFNATPAGSPTTKIFVDFLMPQGLGKVEPDGSVTQVAVNVMISWREVGSGAWTDVTYTYVDNTVDQVGKTETIIVSSTGLEIEVKANRVGINSTVNGVRDAIQWTGLKSELEGESFYADTSVLLLKMRGRNIANNASNKINVIQHRKLPFYDPDTSQWIEDKDGLIIPLNAASRAAVYVMVDAGLDVSDQIDFEGLALLNDYAFDGVFDESSTLFDTLSRIAAVAYCFPAIESGKVTFIRSQPLAGSMGQFFSADNTISITESGSLFDPSEADGTRVEYFSSETWKSEVVDCLLNDGVTVDSGIAPKEIRAFGITDKTAAWRYGMRDRRQRRYLRRTWEVETELEGLNCHLGEIVSLAGRDVQQGALTNYQPPSGTGLARAVVDRPLSVTAGVDYWVVVREAAGKATGFMRAYLVDEYTLDFEFALNWWPIMDGSETPALFKFGTYEQIHIPAIVKSIEPQGDTVRLELGAYDERIGLDDENSPGV